MKLFLTRLTTFLFLFIALALFFQPPSQAATKSVEVTRRDGDVTIDTRGDMHFVETWQVQFIGGPFHFAYRGIEHSRLDSIGEWGVSEGG